MNRSRLTLAALCALVVIAGALALMPSRSSPSATSATTGTSASTGASSAAPAATTVGGPTCPLASLPRGAVDTIRVIHSNGPFPFPRNDGVVFGNREGHLPGQAKGYYHEYTVITPGASNRSTRRIITGGAPVTNPRQYYYTDDHYDSFCLITDAGQRS